MNEVKKPKKPLIYYYGIVLLVVFLFNLLVMPRVLQRQIIETDYGTFLDMIDGKDIGKVEVQQNQILFTNKDGTAIYKTGLMNDPQLVDRLHSAGAQFTQEIVAGIRENQCFSQIISRFPITAGDVQRLYDAFEALYIRGYIQTGNSQP